MTAGALLVAAVFAAVAASASAAPPANDDFAAAQVLSGSFPIEATGSNAEATTEPGEPGLGSSPTGHTIWFQWEAPDSRAVKLKVCGAAFWAEATIYTGSSLATLHQVWPEWRSEAACEGGTGIRVFQPAPGTRYWIQVDGTEGPVSLRLDEAGPPGNDAFAAATPIVADQLTIPTDNFAATKEAGEPAHRGDSGGASVWYSWTAPRTSGAFLQICNGPADAVVAAYTGSSPATLTPVTPLEPEPSCRLSFLATKGVTYRIAVDGKFDAGLNGPEMGTQGLSLGTFPRNDDFESAASLNPFFSEAAVTVGFSTEAFFISYSNLAATKQPGEPNHAGNPGGSSIWFRWVSSTTGSVRFDVCSGNLHALLAAYTGSSLGQLTPVASGESGPPACGSPSRGQVAFNVDAGTEYKLAVDGYNGAQGRFTVHYRLSGERLPVADAKPETKIKRKRIRPGLRLAAFLLGSSEAGSNFRCSLDAHRFSRCGAGVRYSGLRPGRHTFRAKAVDLAGQADPTPVIVHFRIPKGAGHPPRQRRAAPADTSAPQTEILERSVKPGKRRATFNFTSSEAGGGFRCQLDSRPLGACNPPKTYSQLGYGKHVFRVAAVDSAGNTDPSAAIARFSIPRPKARHRSAH